MRIFLTGATGYIGSAVLDALLRANQQVTALVRTPAAADALASRGVAPVLGDLRTVKSYRGGTDGATGATGSESQIRRGRAPPGAPRRWGAGPTPASRHTYVPAPTRPVR